MIKENDLKNKYIHLLQETHSFTEEINQQIQGLNPESMNMKQWQRKHDNLIKKLDRWIKVKNKLTPIALDLIDYKSLED